MAEKIFDRTICLFMTKRKMTSNVSMKRASPSQRTYHYDTVHVTIIENRNNVSEGRRKKSGENPSSSSSSSFSSRDLLHFES